jgi:hypothetical protein
MCSGEEQDMIVKALRKSGRLRTTGQALLLIVTLITSVWVLGERAANKAEGKVRDTAVEVFSEELESFHSEAKPEILEEIDARIQVHSLEESQETQEALGQIKEEVAGVKQEVATINGKLDILIQRAEP